MKDTRKSFNSATLTHSDGQDDTICSHHYHSKMLPTKRSAYYRLCDLKNDEMQQIIHSNDGKEINCTVSLQEINFILKLQSLYCRKKMGGVILEPMKSLKRYHMNLY